MANPKPVALQRRRLPVWIAYAGAVAVFLWIFSQFYLPGRGFTYCLYFGDKLSGRYLEVLRVTDHFEHSKSFGYDGQFYAQIAMQPALGDPALRTAVDSLPYRARRILFSWTAYGLALGDPARAMHIFAVQNAACWLLLAVLLLRWFPANSWDNFLRWAGVMFSFGLCVSVQRALLDGPSLLLIAVGMALSESGRPWWSAAVMGVSGLGRETNVLAGTVFLPKAVRDRRDWLCAFGRWIVVIGPLVIWLFVLQRLLGRINETGLHNFDWPFVGYVHRWRETFAELQHPKLADEGRVNALVLIVLTVQWLFIALRPRWESPWWRLGASYAVLMVFLGDAVWEGYPSAAPRAILPIVLAFNVLVPRGGLRWALVLIAGNLTIFVAKDAFNAPVRESFSVQGPRDLRIAKNEHFVDVAFDDQWGPQMKSLLEYWRWSYGPATMSLRNPHRFALTADVSFRLRSNDSRQVIVLHGGKELARAVLAPKQPQDIELKGVRLEPGDNRWSFETDRPGTAPAEAPRPQVAFSLRNLTIKLRERAPPEPAR